MPSGNRRPKHVSLEKTGVRKWRVSSPRFGPDGPVPIWRTTSYKDACRVARDMANNLKGDFKIAVAWARDIVPFRIKIRYDVPWRSRSTLRDRDTDKHIFELNAECPQPVPELLAFLASALTQDRIRTLPVGDEIDGSAIWAAAYHEVYDRYELLLERDLDGRRKNPAGAKGTQNRRGRRKSAGATSDNFKGPCIFDEPASTAQCAAG